MFSAFIFLLTISHIFSTGFISGELTGQSKRIFCDCGKALTDFAVLYGAPSCMKWNDLSSGNQSRPQGMSLISKTEYCIPQKLIYDII